MVAKLSEPEVSQNLVRLLDRLDTIETSVSAMEEFMYRAPELAESVQKESPHQKRVSEGLALLEKLSDPDVSRSLNRLLDNIDSVETVVSGLNELTQRGPELADSVAHESPYGKSLNEASRLLETLSDPDVIRSFTRLTEKIDTIETMVSAIDEISKRSPELIESMNNESDLGHTIEQYLELGEKLARPEVINNLNHLVDKIENLDAVLNILDSIVRNNPELKVEDSATVRTVNEIASMVIKNFKQERTLVETVTGGLEILNHLNALLLSEKMYLVIDGLSQAMEKKKEDVPNVGLLGFMKQLRDPDVKRAQGLLLVLLKSIGSKLDEFEESQDGNGSIQAAPNRSNGLDF